MLNASSASNTTQTTLAWDLTMSDEPLLREDLIRSSDDYGIPLPEWLKSCIKQVPTPIGECCPTDSEALLASAFDLAFRLHKGQFRVSGDPYIIHPVAVANLLKEIGASPKVIAAGFLHDVVEDTNVSLDQLEEYFLSLIHI